MAENQLCWHCLDSNQCDCLTCAKDGKPGTCSPCVGRKRTAELVAYLDHYNIDPRDRKHWRRTFIDGHSTMQFLPERDFWMMKAGR